MFHVYTYGRESIQFMILTPKQAKLVNEFTCKFFEAQDVFRNTYGRQWTPNDNLVFETSYAENLNKYNKLATWLDRQHGIRNRLFSLLRIDVSKEEPSDFLRMRF